MPYPDEIDALQRAAGSDLLKTAHPDMHEEVADAVEAIETELGVQPKGAYADVASRLDAIVAGAGDDKTFRHIQGTPSTTWTVTHNLGKYPAVTLFDSSGREFKAQIDHVSDNQLTVTLGAALSGEANCN